MFYSIVRTALKHVLDRLELDTDFRQSEVDQSLTKIDDPKNKYNRKQKRWRLGGIYEENQA